MTYEFSIEGVTTKQELQDRILEGLPVPDYYGGNLDALYDVLSTLPTDTRLSIWMDAEIDLTRPDTIPPHLRGFFTLLGNLSEEREDMEVCLYSREF